MRVISFVNQKGGVAKTTSCVNIGASLADQGRRVLLVDLDAQGSLSTSTGLKEIGADELTVYEVLKGADIKEATRTLSESLSVQAQRSRDRAVKRSRSRISSQRSSDGF